MSKGADKVKTWRRKTKERMTAAMGGSCAICGYAKSQGALEFHHLDPAEKDFSFGSIRRNPKNWGAIVEELRKCVLLCCRCHREIHDGITELPTVLPVFDESLADYKALEREILRQDRMNICPICGIEKLKNQKTCSPGCAGANRYRFQWGDLATMRETMSNVQIAKSLGCSEAAVRKRLKQLG